MGEWFRTRIGDQVTLQRGFDITKAEQTSGAVPVVSSGGIASYHEHSKVNGPGVVLGRKGVVGSVYFIDQDYWPHDTTLWVKDFHNNYPRFVYYFFKWFAPNLAIMDFGSANPTLNRNHVHPIEVLWPSAADQEYIGDLLGALDQKIELNRATNETIVSTISAVFRDWFVNLEPVKSRSVGDAAFLPADIWELFPDSLDDEGQPSGWNVSEIGKEAVCVGGGTPSTIQPEYWNGDIYWATPKDFSSLKSPVLLSTERRITAAGLAKISSGLLPVGTLLLSSRAPIGYLAIAEIPTAINQGFIGLICNKRLSNIFVWQWIVANMATILQNANGSTFQEINKANFRPLRITVPAVPILNAFEDIVRPLYQRLRDNEAECTTLSTMRDYLLPRLLLGEIGSKDTLKLQRAL